MEERKEYSTENYDDVKKMQDAIVENSTEFVKLGRSALRGSNKPIIEEKERLVAEINEHGSAQCDACSQEVTKVTSNNDYDNKKTYKEAERIKKEANEGTVCRCCGSICKVETHKLDFKSALAMIEILKFYRHNPNADENGYYTSKDFFAHIDDEYKELFEDVVDELHYWSLLMRMPTRPDKVVYKKGWYGITEEGIKFAQLEIGIPRTCYSYNGENDGFESDFVTAEDLLKEVDLDYNELIKVESE